MRKMQVNSLVELVSRLGFHGKCAIRPAQIAIINEVLTPTEDEVAKPRQVPIVNRQDGMEKLLVDSTIHARSAYCYERPYGECQGRRQPRWGQGEDHRPVFAGDTLYAESTVLSKRESKSRPTQGIVTVFTRGINQDGLEVMRFKRTMLMYKRRHSQLTLLL
jgi:hypothetical protein